MVTFKEKLPGFDTAIVSTRFSQAEISLYGAQVLSWIPEGGEEALFVGSGAVFKQGKAIRGGIPLCFPWFGPRKDDPSLPQHGFARLAIWKPVSFEDDKDRSTLVLGLSDSPETRKLWPRSFAAALAVSVGEALELTLSVTNTGEEALEYTDALHAYFRVSDVRGVSVEGLDKAGFDNLGSEGPGSGEKALRFGEEVNRIYASGSERSIAEQPGKGRVTILSEGFPDTVVWNPGRVKGPAIEDLGEGEWPHFLCVEPAAAGEHRVILAPGATACQMMRIVKEGRR